MKKPYLLISTAWLLHFVAWFLRVIKPGEFRPAIPGWQAFRYAACGVWACKGVQFDAWYYAVLSTISAITTLFFILASPWVVLRGSRSLRRGFAWAAATAFIFNAHWIVIFWIREVRTHNRILPLMVFVSASGDRFVRSRRGIITSYLSLRLVVRSGFMNSNAKEEHPTVLSTISLGGDWVAGLVFSGLVSQIFVNRNKRPLKSRRTFSDCLRSVISMQEPI